MERDITSGQCNLKHDIIEEKLELPFPDNNNEQRKNPQREMELKDEDNSSLESTVLAATNETKLSEIEKQEKIKSEEKVFQNSTENIAMYSSLYYESISPGKTSETDEEIERSN